MINRLIYKEYQMDIAKVVNKLQQINTAQNEIDIVVDALKCSKNPLGVFAYIFKYYRYPNQITGDAVDNLLLKWLFCLSDTEFYQPANTFVKAWFVFTREDIGLILFLMIKLQENGNPTDPEEVDKILQHGIEEYLAASKTGISTN